MTKILGLDVGTKRIGVAISDALLMFAQPNKVILRKSDEVAIDEIVLTCEQNDISEIVVGLPKNMNGSIGPQAENCLEFGKLLENTLNLPVVFEDERLTSFQAEKLLAMQNKKYTKNKSMVDVTAAALILQQNLDRRRINNG